MAAPIGAIVKLYIDGRAVLEVGTVVETTTTGRRYRVLDVRRQHRGRHIGRQHFTAIVIDPAEQLEHGTHIVPIRWCRR